MSMTSSTTVRFEDHFGPVVPEAARAKDPSTPATPLSRTDRTRLGELVEQMRLSVVHATEVTDRAAKAQLWDAYRTARNEALAMLACAADETNTCPPTPRLQSL
jgi:hypothetical protein